MPSADPPSSTAERLIEIALTSFAGRGYEASSLDQIASEAGVRKQTLLYHFTSKEMLLGAVIEYTVHQLAYLVQPPSSARLDPQRWVIDALFRVGTERPELLELVREALRLGPPASERLREAAEPFVAALAAHLPRSKVMGAIAIILGLAAEVDAAAALGITPTIGELRRRRRVLLGYLER